MMASAVAATRLGSRAAYPTGEADFALYGYPQVAAKARFTPVPKP